jgi:hypothetical protein
MVLVLVLALVLVLLLVLGSDAGAVIPSTLEWEL